MARRGVTVRSVLLERDDKSKRRKANEAKRQENPEDDRIASLRLLGLSVEPMTSRRGYWKICATNNPVPLAGTVPTGYGNRDAAINAAEYVVRTLRQYRADADEAYAEYLSVVDTGMNPGHWERQYTAAVEFERTEAGRLGLPARASKIRRRR